MNNVVQIKIFVPGKFFLAGEYSALRGGPTLTIALKPYFSYIRSDSTLEFHKESPAGRLNKNTIKGQLIDPHNGQGGLGLSTAEYIFKYCYHVKESADWGQNKNEVVNCWQAYRHLYLNEKNPPSGVDLITQIMGGHVITYLKNEMHFQNSYQWPFKNLDWVVIKTGLKLATHEHLKNDLSYFNYNFAEELGRKVILSFLEANENEFLQHMKAWGQWLEDENLLANHSKKLIDGLQNIPGFKFAKGCGAMGSDQILVLFDRSKIEEFKKELINRKIDLSQILFSDQLDTRGLHFENT
jgi:mevalonate kinase